jgi:hypothetical protein
VAPRGRRIAGIVLAWLGALVVLGGGLIAYGGHVLSNSEQFATRATSALGDGSMRAVVSRRLTAQIVTARSELIAVRPVVESAVDAVVGSPAFQSIFEGAVYDLHRSVFTNGSDTFTVRLADVVVLAEAGLRQFAPGIAAKLPNGAGATATAVAGGDFRQLSDLARAINSARDAGPWLLLTGGLLLAFSVAVAAKRGVALRRVGFALLLIGLVVLIAYTVARPLVLGRFAAGDARTAAGVVWDAFLADLREWALLTAAAGGIVAALASVLGAQREASIGELVRRQFAGDSSSAAVGWMSAAALVLLGGLALSAPGTVVSAVTVVAGAVVLYAGVRRLLRLALTVEFGKVARGAPVPRVAVSPGRVAGVSVIALLLAFAAVAIAQLTHGEPVLAHPITACNGYAQLCEKRLNDVAFPATHNSMASGADAGWLFAAQDAGISDQLAAGIRGLLIDTHYGFKAPKGIATDLSSETGKLASVVDDVGPEFIRSVERLRGTVGYKGTGQRGVYLCHAFCEVGATLALDALRSVHDFLVRHPDQVVILSVEDDVSPNDTAAVFRDSGLLGLVYEGPSHPWPTLRQLIEQDRRVVVFAENQTGGIPWYRSQFGLVQETPYRFTNTQQLGDPSSCRPNRGGTAKPLFLLNNWVDTSPAPRPANASVVNAYDTLLGRARRCQAERHRLPNLVAVDFYKRGDVLRVTATLNGLRGSNVG